MLWISKHSFLRFLLLAWLNCRVSLPQRSSGNCNILRQQNLDNQKSIYQLAPRPPLPMPLINMTLNQTVAHHTQDPFARNHFYGYLSMLTKNNEFSADWKKRHPKEKNAFQEYQDMFQQFRHNLGSNVSNVTRNIAICICLLPTHREPVKCKRSQPCWAKTSNVAGPNARVRCVWTACWVLLEVLFFNRGNLLSLI